MNKLDSLAVRDDRHPFHVLGLGEPLPVSAATGQGSGDLLDAIVDRLPESVEPADEGSVRVAVIGRPNVGKSSLVNRLLGEERHLVTPVPGTTRDAIDSTLRYHGRALVFIDTAGLRRRARVHEDLEFYSGLRTERALERADVCLLVVDAIAGVHHQDLRLAGRAWDARLRPDRRGQQVGPGGGQGRQHRPPG